MHLSLGKDLGPRVAAYHRSLAQYGIVGTSIIDTIRELILMGLSAAPGEDQPKFDRIQLTLETRRWIFNRLHEAMRQIEEELMLSAAVEPPTITIEDAENMEPIYVGSAEEE